jgi:drug/metabolite transporter (DMT)-like permease
MRNSLAWPGVPLALASAALFGASTPLAKLLLGEGVSPWLLAGLLYLGSGLGLAAAHAARRWIGIEQTEAPLRGKDMPRLALVIAAGGIAAPILLMIGLSHTPASSAALLLNLEGLATMAIAWVVFRENADTRILIGAGAILTGAVLLTWDGKLAGVNWGALAIVGACVAWAVDNNLTRKLSNADPVQIAMAKGIAAGAINLVLALANGAVLPSLPVVAGASIVGFLGYGASLVMFVLALRHLGAARTGAYFSTAPFIGATLGLFLFSEPLTTQLLAAGVLMGIGLYLHLAERHGHTHAHDAMDHEHRYMHDEHHQHGHGANDPPGEPHAHWHHHAPLLHGHAHYPDSHHRHDHK